MSMNPLAVSYFQQVQSALARAELAEPVLVIDRDRLDANIDKLKKQVNDKTGEILNIVKKIQSNQ